MLEEIKKELLSNPGKLKELLKYFNFYSAAVHQSYISFGRSEYSSKKSIVIRLGNNPYLYVKDYARNINQDLFTYISRQRGVQYADILSVARKILGINDCYSHFENQGIFGGFYERIKKKNTSKVRIYEETLLDRYERCGNLRFLRDNISLEAQKFFNIRYDTESHGIVIPIYSQLGQLMGVKIRCNYDTSDGELKYYYLIPCAMSQTLYGYSHNYNYLAGSTVYIFESEKSVMQCYSYGIRNCVALGSGSISGRQVQMLFSLNPERLVFMHDTGFAIESIKRNISLVKAYSRFSDIKTGYWDYFGKGYEDKISPSDLGGRKLGQIMKEEIVMAG